MIPLLVINRHSKQVTRTDSISLPLTEYGAPAYIPGKGDQVTVSGVLYTVSHLHWDMDAKTVTIYASRRDD